MRKPFVMGNWKLNGSKIIASDLVTSLKHHLSGVNGCDVAIAPPVMYLEYVNRLLEDSHIALGAQNTDISASGAYTGDISPSMLKDMGVKYVIIGHSERRQYHNESDAIIAKKFMTLKQHHLIPVLCIGETEAENEAGKTEKVCAKQIDAIFDEAGLDAFDNTVIAYEPIWAIGTGKSATPAQAEAIHQFIRHHIADKNAESAKHLIIQYGGSVNENNAAELFAQPNIDGALVGGASLKANSFSEIVKAAAQAKSE